MAKFKKGNKEQLKASREGRGAKPKYLEMAFKEMLQAYDCGQYNLADKALENIKDMLHERVPAIVKITPPTAEELAKDAKAKPKLEYGQHTTESARMATMRVIDGIWAKATENINHTITDDTKQNIPADVMQTAKEEVASMLKKGKRG